jgi:hypothetical protein
MFQVINRIASSFGRGRNQYRFRVHLGYKSALQDEEFLLPGRNRKTAHRTCRHRPTLLGEVRRLLSHVFLTIIRLLFVDKYTAGKK